jgi:hypothetical protein
MERKLKWCAATLLSLLVILGVACLFIYSGSFESVQVVEDSTADEVVIRSDVALLSADIIRPIAQKVLEEHENATRIQKTSLTGKGQIPGDEQESLWRAFSDARHQIRPLTNRQKELAVNEGVHFFAQNPRNQLTAHFASNCVKIRSGYPGREWTGSISAGEGFPESIRQKGTRLEYDFGSVVEWYHNRPDGIEQGWILKERQESEPSGRLTTLCVAVDGLEAEPLAGREHGTSDLQFVNTDGEAVLACKGLKAWDAVGHELPVRMEPSAGGFAIHVAAAEATYPIIIDPLFISLEDRLGPEVTGGGGKEDRFGHSVSLQGNRFIVGVPSDNDIGYASGSAYVFTRTGEVWTEETKLTSSDSDEGDQFGTSVSLDGDRVLIGSKSDEVGGVGTGSAYVFVYDGESWNEEDKMTASDAGDRDQFGGVVSLWGDRALIGASGNSDFGGTTGSAYIFERSGSNWIQVKKLLASDAGSSAYYGFAVSLDGDTALIGAFGDDASGFRAGAAYVYERNGGTWDHETKLEPADANAYFRFGEGLSLDGDIALIGASGYSTTGYAHGAAYVFVRNGGTWSQQARLIANDPDIGSAFGRDVSLSGDTALIGASADEDDDGDDKGAAYVFVRSEGSWTQEVKIKAFDRAENDGFGSAVSIDGDTVVIGAPDDDDLGNRSGSVYVYVRDGANWDLEAKLTPGDAAIEDYFGYSLAIDGDTAVIGAYGDHDLGSGSGSAYIFLRSGTEWNYQAKLLADDGAHRDFFGYSVDLSGDTAVIGAYGNDKSEYIRERGAAYIFVRSGVDWSQEAKLIPSDDTDAGYFGYSVSLDGDSALIGASHSNGGDMGCECGSGLCLCP